MTPRLCTAQKGLADRMDGVRDRLFPLQKVLLTLGMVLGFCIATTAGAQDFEMSRPLPPPADAQIIGGRPSILSEWPATLVFDANQGACTATIIGPRVILTAAHCVRPGGKGTVNWANGTVRAECDHHPGYRRQDSLDIALCLTSTVMTFPPQAGPERLSSDPLSPPAATQLLLQGFGCRRVGGGGAIGVLYEGDATVEDAADLTPVIVTLGGAAVCYGDSGGSSFLVNGLRRQVVGVNARGDILERSFLTAVAHPAVLRFIRSWMAEKQVGICGLTPNLTGCHA